jgi:hypothetical protein
MFKNPSKYNDDDIKAIEVYKHEVKNLEIQREKYKKHLEFEINSTNGM